MSFSQAFVAVTSVLFTVGWLLFTVGVIAAALLRGADLKPWLGRGLLLGTALLMTVALANFLRGSWGNRAAPVAPESVARQR